MSGRKKGQGKGLEESMLAAAKAGWSGVLDGASEAEVQAVRDKYPEIFKVQLKPFARPHLQRLKPFDRSDGLPGAVRQTRLSGDAPARTPVDATVCEGVDAPGESSDDLEDQVLRYGISTAAAASRDNREREWFTERYAVREGIIRDILMRLQLSRPKLDVFADESNRRMERWYGPGGEVEDAFSVSWHHVHVGGLMWMNPPYSALEKTIKKVIEDGAEAIMVLPDWRSTQWWKDIQKYVRRRYWYPPGVKVFELSDSDFNAGTRWGVWAYYVKGHCPREVNDEEFIVPDKEYIAGELEGTHQKTSSRRRRQQRKAAAKYWQGWE